MSTNSMEAVPGAIIVKSNAIKKPIIREGDGSPIKCYALDDISGEELSNWGGNILFKPTFVFEPKTKEGVCNIVKWANASVTDKYSGKRAKLRAS